MILLSGTQLIISGNNFLEDTHQLWQYLSEKITQPYFGSKYFRNRYFCDGCRKKFNRLQEEI